jgi:hypothetical protein
LILIPSSIEIFSLKGETMSAPTLVCQICGGSVPVETAVTDEDGMAVHEDCYAAKVKRVNGGSNSTVDYSKVPHSNN